MVHQLIYVSAASPPMTPTELGSLLLKARATNTRLGVGGMLIHHEGSFIQILEGERAVVENLFQRIERDARHHRVVVLSRADSADRVFEHWSMGFVDGALSLSSVPGFNDFFQRGFDHTGLAPSASEARSLVSAFRAGRFRQFLKA